MCLDHRLQVLVTIAQCMAVYKIATLLSVVYTWRETRKEAGNLQHRKCGKSKIAWGSGCWETEAALFDGGSECKREEVLREKRDGEADCSGM